MVAIDRLQKVSESNKPMYTVVVFPQCPSFNIGNVCSVNRTTGGHGHSGWAAGRRATSAPRGIPARQEQQEVARREPESMAGQEDETDLNHRD
jgi:hypothetical protein